MSEIDTSSEEFQAAVKAALDDEAKGLKSALEAERKARKDAEKAAAKFKDVDLDKYQQVMTDAEKAEEQRQREAGKFDELLEKERKKFETAQADRDTKIATLTASLERTLIESAAKSAIAQHGGDAELLLPHVTRSTKLIEHDGKHLAVVVDERGEPKLAPDAKNATEYMGIEHLVSGWKEGGKFAGAFAGTGASGGGAVSSGGGGRSAGPVKTVSESDFLANLDGIAKGEVKVAVGQ